jgi:hypothetical protein
MEASCSKGFHGSRGLRRSGTNLTSKEAQFVKYVLLLKAFNFFP